MGVKHKHRVYRQCRLRRGDTITSAWIPITLAKKGSFISIKGIDGWRAESVGQILDWEDLLLVKDDYKYTRKRTDI